MAISNSLHDVGPRTIGVVGFSRSYIGVPGTRKKSCQVQISVLMENTASSGILYP